MWHHIKIIHDTKIAKFKFAAHWRPWLHWNGRTKSEFKRHPVKYDMRANAPHHLDDSRLPFLFSKLHSPSHNEYFILRLFLPKKRQGTRIIERVEYLSVGGLIESVGIEPWVKLGCVINWRFERLRST